MKFVFTDKKVSLPASVHAYAEKKVGKLDRYFSSEAEAAITFRVEKDRNRAEVTVRSGSMILRASESTSDMRASIDAAVSTIERQIRKNKARLEKRLRKDAFERSVDVAEVSDFVPEEEEEFRIERVKRFPIKPMTREEAILHACPLRVRPILMTTLTTVIAMIPMALGIGETNEMMTDMGVTMISGMVISTVITLVFTPVYYSVIDDLSHTFRRKKKEAEPPVPAEVG